MKEPDERPLAVCLVSGGLDSCVTAALAARDHRSALLHSGYGQLTRERELRAFNDIADYLGVPRKLRLVVAADYLKKIGGSTLTGGTAQASGSIPSTYVPFRNANLLAIGVSWAEVIGAGSVFIGAMEEDSSGYPDCRESFIRAFNQAVEEGTRPDTRIRIRAPLIHMSKADVIRLGADIKAPLHLTWSCYRSAGPEACGECASCLLRLKGFREAGIPDPIKYAGKC